MQETACNAGDLGLIPGLGRSPGEGNGNPLQYSCLGNPVDRKAWWATVHGVARTRHDLATKPLLLLSRFTRVRLDPIDGSPPGSAVPGILQARTLLLYSYYFSMNQLFKIYLLLIEGKLLYNILVSAIHLNFFFTQTSKEKMKLFPFVVVI